MQLGKLVVLYLHDAMHIMSFCFGLKFCWFLVHSWIVLYNE